MKEYSTSEKLIIYNSIKLDTSMTWILFLMFGWSYGSIGQYWKQIFYYLTFGGMGIWTLYLVFTLQGKIKKYNGEIADKMQMEADDRIMLNI